MNASSKSVGGHRSSERTRSAMQVETSAAGIADPSTGSGFARTGLSIPRQRPAARAAALCYPGVMAGVERPPTDVGTTTQGQAFYTDAGWHERELSAIHYRMWLYAGRLESIPSPGDYFVFD